MGKSLLTTPKAYGDPFTAHLTPSSVQCRSLAAGSPSPLIYCPQQLLRQYFPVSKAPCPATRAGSAQQGSRLLSLLAFTALGCNLAVTRWGGEVQLAAGVGALQTVLPEGKATPQEGIQCPTPSESHCPREPSHFVPGSLTTMAFMPTGDHSQKAALTSCWGSLTFGGANRTDQRSCLAQCWQEGGGRWSEMRSSIGSSRNELVICPLLHAAPSPTVRPLELLCQKVQKGPFSSPGTSL